MSEPMTIEAAAAELGVTATTLTRFIKDGRVEGTDGGVTRAEVDRILEDRRQVKAHLDAARASRQTVEQEIADELGLSDEQAKRLGLDDDKGE